MITNLSDADQRRLRIQWRDLIDIYNSLGKPEMAHGCAQLAVSQGVWREPAQRPIDYDPSIEPAPVVDASRIEVCRYLEKHFPVMSAEIEELSAKRGANTGYFAVHEPLVVSGSWDELMFYEAGIRVAGSAALLPRTAEILDALPDSVRRAGAIMLSKLSPGTHLAPHCGFTNRRLRVHLGIQTPPDALIRVGDQTLEWKRGRCLVFDDSFEHEVWHFGTEPRIVLLADLSHPQATHPYVIEVGDIGRRVEEFMSNRGLSQIIRGADGELTMRPDAQHNRMMQKWIAELGVDSVALNGSGRLQHDARR